MIHNYSEKDNGGGLVRTTLNYHCFSPFCPPHLSAAVRGRRRAAAGRGPISGANDAAAVAEGEYDLRIELPSLSKI